MKLTLDEAIGHISQCVGTELCSPECEAAFGMAVAALREQKRREDARNSVNTHSVRFCPKCNGDSIVYNSRPTQSGCFRRDRKCRDCGFKYRTLEMLFFDAPVEVQE